MMDPVEKMNEKIIVVAICAALLIFELIPLFRNDGKRVAAVYTVLLSLAAVLFFIADSGLQIPSVSDILKSIAGVL